MGDRPPLLQAMAEKGGGVHSLTISDRGGQEEPPPLSFSSGTDWVPVFT